ncbi:MAG: tetratricopeptide repeat protein [Symploca sp. SIO2E6]|nr:tetratricopeptide repeat protein [Symploca sp. SIO2E6]
MTDQAKVLIITVTKVESSAVIETFRPVADHEVTPKRINNRIYFNLGTVNGVRVFLTQSEMGSGGLGASYSTVNQGIEALSPIAVIMVGIAFGIDEHKQAIGDILVTEQLCLYDLQRQGTQDGKPQIILRGDKSHASWWLINHFKSADLLWDGAKVHFGVVLTGNKLVDNVDFLNQLRDLEPEAIGGEMEGEGLYVACQEKKVDWILVKSICDWADGNKEQDKEKRQEIAARNAAEFVLKGLQFAPLNSKEEPGERKNEWGNDSADAETRRRGDAENGNPTSYFVHPEEPTPNPSQEGDWRQKVEGKKYNCLSELDITTKNTPQLANKEISRPSRMRSPVPDEYYIKRDEAERLLTRLAISLKEPDKQPLLFNIYGIGGVGKTTLLGRLQQAHAGEVDFLGVCFTKTPDIETPLKLMRHLHRQAQQLVSVATIPDAFAQQVQQFETALFQLSRQSVDGEATTPEEARKITSWFERFVWLNPTGFTTTSSKSKSWESSGSGFSAFSAIANDTEGLQEWIQQQVRHHRATKDKPQLQALMLEPVARLTQAFAESLVQIAESRAKPLVLVLDTYENAQTYLNQWLWQYLVEDTPLSAAPVRLVVVGRKSLQADEGWRKLNQDRKLLHEVQLNKFSKKQTDNYLKQIGIKKGSERANIYKVTQGLPYYLDWVRKQSEQGKKKIDFSQGNQAIAKLLLQGIDTQQQKILQVVACCRWFDLGMLQYLLGKDGLGLQEDAEKLEGYFEWLKNSDFVEFSKGHYRLDDVARDVFRQSCFQDSRSRFYQTNVLLANYFKQQADELFAPPSRLPDPYEDEEWRKLIAEFLYYSLFGKRREGLQQYVEQVFVAVYLGVPDVFMAPSAFIRAEMNTENQDLLLREIRTFFEDVGIVLSIGWFFLDESPGSYKIQFEDENTPSEEAAEAFSKQMEASIQSLLGYVGDLEDGFGKGVGLIYKALRCHSSREKTDSLLQAKNQVEQLLAHFRPKLAHSLFSHIASLLISTKSYEDSLDCYQKALGLGQGNALLFVGQGIALNKLERYEEALESFQTAIDIDPQSVYAWGGRGNALNKLERYEEALESYQKAIDLNTQSVYAWVGRGNALFNLKQYEEALVAYTHALRIEPKNHKALNMQALTLSFLKDFDKAITAIDQAINLKPQEVLYQAHRGIILARAGRYTEALADCEQAIHQDPQHVISIPVVSE